MIQMQLGYFVKNSNKSLYPAKIRCEFQLCLTATQTRKIQPEISNFRVLDLKKDVFLKMQKLLFFNIVQIP